MIYSIFHAGAIEFHCYRQIVNSICAVTPSVTLNCVQSNFNGSCLLIRATPTLSIDGCQMSFQVPDLWRFTYLFGFTLTAIFPSFFWSDQRICIKQISSFHCQRNPRKKRCEKRFTTWKIWLFYQPLEMTKQKSREKAHVFVLIKTKIPLF